MNNPTYKFVTKKNNDLHYNPEIKLHNFYQICNFKDQHTGKHYVRVSMFNQDGILIKTENRKYSPEQLKLFFNNHKQNQYKIYATSDLNLIDKPNPANIFESKSELLNNDYTTYDYAKF